MGDRIRVVHCGLGKWGPNVLRNLAQSERFEVAALCDASTERLAEFAAQFPDARIYASIEEAAADPSIDAAAIATPAGLHAEHCRTFLEAGKDVLVEKPLAMTLDGARALVELAERNRRVLMAGHTFLFNPAVRRVKRAIEDGALGKLQYIQAERMSLGQIRQDCNALWNLAPHDVSILLDWLGAMPESVTARGLAFNEGHVQEDIALCILEFPGRIVASIQVSWLNPVKIRRMTVVGSNGMLTYDDVNADAPVTLFHQCAESVASETPEGSLERFRLEIKRGPSENLDVEKAEPLALEIAAFAEAIRTRETPAGSGAEALRIVSVLEACDRSMKAGGKPIAPESI